MPSLVTGYEYDIFISYRQKDNKYDGWITDFVDHLRKELEATFKEDISIYFDENPHDGLLEAHHVDRSLEGKLKCLILIPVLSQTYCDPKSFAWNNEFLVFRDIAATDTHGLNIKLSNGNVVSRILPVRIHDLDASDRSLFERENGAPLRSVDFIFKSAGVNRPLCANEDHPHDNLNKTYYRDQINKVANLVKGIIFSISRGPDDKANAAELLPLRKDPPLMQKVNSDSDYFLHEVTPEPPGTDSPGKRTEWRRQMAIPLLFAVLVLTIVSAWGWFRSGPEISALLPTYSTIPVESPYGSIDLYRYFAMSPDGRTIAYSQAGKGIVLKTLSSFSEKLLAGTERAHSITFSPDGKSLAYVKDGGIHKIGITGAPISLISNVSGSDGMSWAIDGNIYFSGGQGSAGIWRVTAAGGGKPEEVTSVYDSLGENAHTWPQLLPDKNTLLFTVMGASDNHEDSRVVIENIKTRKRKVLVEKRIFGRYLSNGYLIFATNDGSVFTAPFGLKDLEFRGQAVTILSGVTTGFGGAVFLAVSENGNMVFLPRNNRPLYVLDVMDRAGKLISDSNLVSGNLSGTAGLGWATMNLSPSGEELAITGRSYGKQDIWVLQIKTGNADRITFDIAQDERPVWSAEGNEIAYTSTHTGTSRRLFIKASTGGSPRKLIGTWPRHIHFTSWSPDGKWLAAEDFHPTSGMDGWVISVDGSKSIPVATGSANESSLKFSPDGRWLAFQSGESGRAEIYVMSFPSLQNKRQLSVDGGTQPEWDRSGKFIYYLQNGFLIAHAVETIYGFEKGKAERLFPTAATEFAISPDGDKFYVRSYNTEKDYQPLHLVTNWFQEFPGLEEP